MGNLSFLVTQKNNFNVEEIKELVENEFPQYVGEISTEFAYSAIQFRYIAKKEDYLICDMYIEKCYLLDELGLYTEQYEEEEDFNSIRNEIELEEANLDKNNSLCITYGIGDHTNRDKIVKFLQKHYNAYWLDEGIHPEYLGPDYFEKEAEKLKSIESKKNWWQKLFS